MRACVHVCACVPRAFRGEVRAAIDACEGAGPVVVHCTAGIGRTALFIALDSLLLATAALDPALDVQEVASRLRTERTLMVQTLKQ